MSEANKISIPPMVRERLRAVPGPASHPDANQLSAFAENTLSARERAQVMDHLATCADCRNIIALALPELEEAALPAAAKSAKRFDFRWTGARWTAFAAAAAVLVAVVIVYRVQSAPENNVAMYNKPPAASLPSNGIANKGADQRAAATTVVSPDIAENERKDARAEQKELAAGNSAAAKIQPLDKQAAVPARPLEDNTKTVDLEGSRDQKLGLVGGVTGPKRIISPQQQMGQMNALTANAAQNTPSAPVKKADESNAAAVANAFSISPRDSLRPGTLPSANANVQYSTRAGAAAPIAGELPASNTQAAAPAPVIAGAGALQASKARAAMAKSTPAPAAPSPTADTFYDSNGFVARKAESAPASASETVEVTGQAPTLTTQSRNVLDLQQLAKAQASATWRVHSGRMQQSLDSGKHWSNVQVAKAVGFDSVSAVGALVWAGGSNGVLYHSTDGGASWAMQWSYIRDAAAKNPARYPLTKPPSYVKGVAPANITKVKFDDALNGAFWIKVGGETPQEFLFTTNDGGQHWYEETVD